MQARSKESMVSQLMRAESNDFVFALQSASTCGGKVGQVTIELSAGKTLASAAVVATTRRIPILS